MVSDSPFQNENDTQQSLVINGVNLETILNDYPVIEIPPYQRSYDWTPKEWAELWSDLNEVMDLGAPAYFIGPLNAERLALGNGIQVADGQQRLTSLAILMSALRGRLSAESRTTLNNLLFAGSVNETLEKRPCRIQDQTPEGQASLSRVLLAEIPTLDSQISNKHERAHNYFGKEVAKLSSARAEEFFLILRKKVIFARVVALEVGAGLKMFERSNTRGRPLTFSDKLKSLLIGTASPTEAPEVIANWSATVSALRTVKKYDDRGFIQWLSADHVTDDKPLRANSALEFARQLIDPIKGLGVIATSRSLLSFAQATEQIWQGKTPNGRQLCGSLENLQNFARFSQLMRVLPAARELKESDFISLAERVENTICVVAIAKAFPPDIEKRMPGLLKYAREAPSSSSALQELITELRSLRDLYSEDFGNKIVNGTLADFRTLPYLKVLWGLMDQYVSNLNRTRTGQLRRQKVSISDASIEHILAKSPNARKAAKEYGGHHALYDRQRFPNLTPLERGHNYGDKPYSEKISSYVNSNFYLTRTMSSKFDDHGLKQFREGRKSYLPAYKSWNRDQLERRAHRLNKLAAKALDFEYSAVEFTVPDRPTLDSQSFFPRVHDFDRLATALSNFSDGEDVLSKEELSTLRFIGVIEEVDSEDQISEVGQHVLEQATNQHADLLKKLAIEVPYVLVWSQLSASSRPETLGRDVEEITGRRMKIVEKQIVTCLNHWVTHIEH